MQKIYHRPVMTEEVIEFLKPEPGKIFVDGTIGEGGHAKELAKKLEPGGRIVGFDRDSQNLPIAEKRLKEFDIVVNVVNRPYWDIKEVLQNLKIKKVDGVLLDLGFSSRQIKAGKRGFSFTGQEPLDMRYDVTEGIAAKDWLNKAGYKKIKEVLKNYGEESESSKIAKSIIEFREKKPIQTSRQLADIVASAKVKKKTGINPATKTFQAIRIFINKELQNLKKGISKSLETIREGGVLGVLTYHSLEDRKVKETFRTYAGKCSCPTNFPVCRCGAENIKPKIEILKESGLRPSEKEIAINPAARSAHLRLAKIKDAY